MTDKPVTAKAEVIAEQLRELIVDGTFLPGQELRQGALARMLNVSRVPVREALQTLVATGEVRHVPDSGYSVARLTASELGQVYELRDLFEDELLAAIDSVDEDALQRLDSLHGQMAALVDTGGVAEFQRLNLVFHLQIFALAGLDLIAAEVERLWLLSEPYRALWARDPRHRERSVMGHDEMLAALRAGRYEDLRRITKERRGALTSDLKTTLTV